MGVRVVCLNLCLRPSRLCCFKPTAPSVSTHNHVFNLVLQASALLPFKTPSITLPHEGTFVVCYQQNETSDFIEQNTAGVSFAYSRMLHCYSFLVLMYSVRILICFPLKKTLTYKISVDAVHVPTSLFFSFCHLPFHCFCLQRNSQTLMYFSYRPAVLVKHAFLNTMTCRSYSRRLLRCGCRHPRLRSRGPECCLPSRGAESCPWCVVDFREPSLLLSHLS